jgi:hypothetical protein
MSVVRRHPLVRADAHNVFGIQVGVRVNLFVRGPKGPARG